MQILENSKKFNTFDKLVEMGWYLFNMKILIKNNLLFSGIRWFSF